MTAGIVIVAWNGERYLPDCLQSVLSQSDSPRDIVVIDNASDDRSREIVQSFVPAAERVNVNLQMVCHGRNEGFTRGANAGIRVLTSTKSPVDIVVLLNQDATLDANWCEIVAGRFANEPRIGAIGSKILHPNRQTIQHAGGYLERPRLVGRHFGHYNRHDPSLFNTEREVEFVTAAAMGVRLRALTECGYFDEVFSPGYYEDVDLCQRLHEAGWKIQFCPDVVAVHAESASFNNRAQRLKISNRSRLIYALPWLVDKDARAEFARAERLHTAGDISTDERRALSAAYLELLLMLPRALHARVGPEQASRDLLTELTETFSELRDLIVAKKWTSLTD